MNEYDDESVDEIFEAMLDANAALEVLIEDLRAVGVRVQPDQHHIVVKWLDMFSVNTPIPVRKRLAMLKGWLKA